MASLYPFHLAIPVNDLVTTRKFYVEVLGCGVGRTADTWIDFDFYGHQVSAHVKPDEVTQPETNPVDGEEIPVRHFGVVLDMDAWDRLKYRLEENRAEFIIEPTIRFKGQVGEQATMFISDPSGNVLEFKAFRNKEKLFASEEDR